jgi:hypothetical protein
MEQPMAFPITLPEAVVFSTPYGKHLQIVRGWGVGWANLVWYEDYDYYSEAPEIIEIGGVCPIEVKSAENVTTERLSQEMPICLDVDGNPLELMVGDTATISLDAFSRNVSFGGGGFWQPGSLLTLPTKSSYYDHVEVGTFEIVARKAGSMTLMREVGGDTRADACLVIIH